MKRVKLLVLVWAVRTFWTAQGVTEFLNSLPPERALEAKVAMPEISQNFYVFYRMEIK